MQMMGHDDVSEELVKKKLIGTKILHEETGGGSSGVEKTPPPKATIEKLEFKDKNTVDTLFTDVRNAHTKCVSTYTESYFSLFSYLSTL
jgi:hypothetical protein